MSDTAGITLSLDQGAGRRDEASRRQPALILALECARPSALSARYSLGGVSAVALGRGGHRAAQRSGDGPGAELTVKVPDLWMSSRHARIDFTFGRWVLEDQGSKNGTVVNGVTTRRAVLADGDLVELGRTLFMFRDGVPFGAGDPSILDLNERPPTAPGLVTLVLPFARELAKLAHVAGADIPVMLQGDSGTGKEVLARAVHALSRRRGEFVAVNCGAIPEHLVESELFGHRRGAFSGAVEHREGLIRSADRGTLFLDEIGDLPPSSQATLLRVLQEREVVPVGASRPVPVDLRVVVATHRDLDAMVARGEFRHDLFARLAGFRLALPPLRARRDDLGLLTGLLLGKLARRRAKISPAATEPTLEIGAARQLFVHQWPLNVRELEQALATAVVLAGGAPIALAHLPEAVRRGDTGPIVTDDRSDATRPRARPPLGPEDARLCEDLRALMRAHAGNVSAVAREMGKDRKQIQRWLKRFGLSADDFRP
ncbi:sigma 54-interacting transcriptional regulator [Haliangium sp.]|uniref:sigma 54-interacting transcriptional regulator n=1 Tax=Haliangium sp. TaxID=2663208 RepID=UPI003D0D6AF6